MSASGLLMGFDYGTRQIGIAIGQTVTREARELCIIRARDGIPDWNQIERLLKEWQPVALVIGLPLNMDGSPSEMSRRAEKFARRLHGRFNLPVHTHDERLTTFEARQSGGREGELVDGIAAALLLQSWLNRDAADPLTH